MGRAMIVGIAISSLLTFDASAATHKKVTTHKKAKAKAKAKAKKRVAKRVKRHHHHHHHTTDPHPRIATTAKPLVTVAKLQADGRVRYGPDRLPPGFAWPPTPAMVAASRACEAQLDTLGITWKAADPEGIVADPIVVPAMKIGGVRYTSAYRRKSPPAMDCQFVRALAALGPELRALGVAEVRFGSVYRNTLARSHGQTKDFLSRHALGIAMDVKAFVDDTGRVATVETDYLKADPLLHGIEDLINKRTDFRDVLSPANDPISHDNHFHIEASVDFTGFR
jgi:hypothetical protein